MGFQLGKQECQDISNAVPGSIERALKLVKQQISSYVDEAPIRYDPTDKLVQHCKLLMQAEAFFRTRPDLPRYEYGSYVSKALLCVASGRLHTSCRLLFLYPLTTSTRLWLITKVFGLWWAL